MMGAREDERRFAEKWAKDHNVTIEVSTDILSDDTYHLLNGYDGLSLQQTMGIPAEMYEKLSQDGFRQIAQRSAGVDMYDLKEAKKHGISITNVPAYSPNAIAEFTVASALNCLRHMQAIQKRVKNHNFSWDKSILAREVRSLTIGVMGTGRIGQITAQLFAAFGAKVIGYDVYQNPNAENYLTYIDSFDEFLAQSDLLTIHMPLTDDNYHQFNTETFNKMKPGAILLNPARGAIIDTKDLIAALDSGQISCCALDTYENEMPYVTKDWSGKTLNDPILEELINREDVLYTPHIAFYTETAVENLVFGGLDACLSILTNGTADTIVNP
ncbi:lactate dehydrogenase [Vagococcus penaei]|nr:lactate dehydrogenase [Vagococcus penaei]